MGPGRAMVAEGCTPRPFRHLGPAALAKARIAALKLERRAYRIAEVYRDTPLAHPRRVESTAARRGPCP